MRLFSPALPGRSRVKMYKNRGLLQIRSAAVPFLRRELLHAALIGLDHLLDHLAADAAGFTRGQVAVVAVLQVDAHLPWCPRWLLILQSPLFSTVFAIGKIY